MLDRLLATLESISPRRQGPEKSPIRFTAMGHPAEGGESGQRLRGESPGEFPGRELSTQASSLTRPQRYEVSRSCRLGTGPEGCHRATREREFRGEVGHWADFADEAVHDGARRPPGEDVGDRRDP